MALRNSRTTFGAVAKFLHWIMAALILSNYVFEQFMHRLAISPLKWLFYDLHKSVGLTVLLLWALRLAWRSFSPAPASPSTLPAVQRTIARASHVLLYVCMLVMPVSGFIGSKAGGFAASWFGIVEMPDLFGKNDAINFWAEAVHTFTAYGLLALVCVHASAALHHHFVRRDAVMARMLPGTISRNGWVPDEPVRR